MQGVWVQFLVRDLTSHMSSGQKTKNIEQKQYCNKFNKDLKGGPHKKILKIVSVVICRIFSTNKFSQRSSFRPFVCFSSLPFKKKSIGKNYLAECFDFIPIYFFFASSCLVLCCVYLPCSFWSWISLLGSFSFRAYKELTEWAVWGVNLLDKHVCYFSAL